MRLFLIFYFCVYHIYVSFAQNKDIFSQSLTWSKEANGQFDLLTDGIYSGSNDQTLYHYASIPFKKVKLSEYTLTNIKTELASTSEQQKQAISETDFSTSLSITEIRGKYFLNIVTNALRRTREGKIEKLISYDLVVTSESLMNAGFRGPESTFVSALTSGDIYKLSVDKTGIYKIDKNFLETKLGLDLSKIDPLKIKIFGNKGGKIPESNSVPRIDDLQELAIQITGESDKRFDSGDYILFYGEGADAWRYSNATNTFDFEKNIYDDKNYYFLKIDAQDGLRIRKNSPVVQPAQADYATFDMIQRLEEDKVNLLGSYAAAEGTGKEWYGDYFGSGTREKNYTSKFDFTGLVPSIPIEVKMCFAGRSLLNTVVSLNVGEKEIKKNILGVNVLNSESIYCQKALVNESFPLRDANPQIKVSYPSVGLISEGWLDYLQIVSGRELTLSTGQMPFHNRLTKNHEVASFMLKNYTNQAIWDVTDPLSPVEMPVENSKIRFMSNGRVREFVSHTGLTSAFEPTGLGKLTNQNLHAMNDQDMIVVTHPKFLAEAQRLAEHRKKNSGLKVQVVTTEQVYNEFSSGRTDPGAIRDMAKMLLERNPAFRYLLLFGDGSYDYKGLVKEISNENFVPAYETDESLDPIDGFPSDDFYGLLGQDEGLDLKGSMDIYVGRLPAKSADEAATLVNKIIHYETSAATLGDWRMRAGYVADDEDGNTHLRDMDEIATADEERHKLINQQKVYIDAFKQVSTPGENRYPEANKAINDNVFKGQLSLTYLGHGGPLGWAQERILTVPDIQSWTNLNNMPVMITATCSFAAYDDPSVVTPAEYALLNARGGAIGLLSTTRAVYTNSNKILTDGVHELMLGKVKGLSPTLGYILAESKNKFQGDFFRINSRKFTLLGDPSMPVALPKYQVVTTNINNKNAATTSDTISALEKVTVKGFIADERGQVLTGFNGTIYPTVFDKKALLQTLSNDSGSPKFSYNSYRSIIFKGAASVQNGQWTFSFWVPKNINYSFGYGRISYYAIDGTTDASGVYSNLIIGGTSHSVVQDDQGPRLDLYLNNESFVSGGVTNSNPVLLMDIKDDYGINVTGNAVGQDITAVLDGNNQNIYVLNEFYEAAKDDFSKGRVKFPLSKLEKGNHFIVTKAWDIAGNSTEKRIDFTVSDISDNVLKHVYNYPNPFTKFTQFQFEHNLSGTELDIQIDIYTITGKLIKSITQTKYSSGFRVNDITWDGKDDYDSSLARGIYLYKVKIFAKELNITKESGFEKLVKL
jgi:hypothetical protein